MPYVIKSVHGDLPARLAEARRRRAGQRLQLGAGHFPDFFFVSPVFLGDRADRLRHQLRAPGRHRRRRARLAEGARRHRALPGGPAHPARALRARGQSSTRTSCASCSATCACPTRCAATSSPSTPPTSSAPQRMAKMLRGATASSGGARLRRDPRPLGGAHARAARRQVPAGPTASRTTSTTTVPSAPPIRMAVDITFDGRAR